MLPVVFPVGSMKLSAGPNDQAALFRCIMCSIRE